MTRANALPKRLPNACAPNSLCASRKRVGLLKRVKLAGAAARRFVEKPDANMRAALFFGPNRSLVAESCAALARTALKGSDDPFATTRLNEDEIKKDKARLSDALAAQSLLGGPTLVWARVDGESVNDSILFTLKEIESGIAGGFLILEGGELSTSGKLAKAFENAKHAVVAAFYEESEGERAAFARDLCKELNVILDRDASESLMSLLPSDRGLARKEIEKLAAYAYSSDKPLTASEIETLIADEGDEALDQAGLAALNGNAAIAVETLSRIEGLSGVQAIKALERRLLRLLDARARVDGGMNAQDAMAKLRPPVFWKEKDAFAAQLRNWPSRKLIGALDLCWEAEVKSKRAGAPQDLLAADAHRAVAKLVGR
ncbi:MAG: DNA polymerase III subunit delta [Caulobacterales bacterium]